MKIGESKMVGIGCDIVNITRMKSLMKKEGHVRFLTKEEMVLYQTIQGARACEWLAGRFAAKEAVIKAMAKEKKLLLSDISILYEGSIPICNIDGYELHVSIAHEQEYAIAYVIAQKSKECL